MFCDGAGHHERFGQVVPPAVSSRTLLVVCHGELGAFAAGRVLGEEGLRIAEAMAHPASLMYGYWGLGLLALYQGDLQGALPALERAIRICQDANLSFYFSWMAATLGAAYTWLGALPTLCRCSRRRRHRRRQWKWRTLRHSVISVWEAQLRADRLEEAGPRRARARRCAPATRLPGVCPAPPR